MQESIKMNERSQNLYNLSQQDNVVYHNKNIYIYMKKWTSRLISTFMKLNIKV